MVGVDGFFFVWGGEVDGVDGVETTEQEKAPSGTMGLRGKRE